jgi:hypothetical protein
MEYWSIALQGKYVMAGRVTITRCSAFTLSSMFFTESSFTTSPLALSLLVESLLPDIVPLETAVTLPYLQELE